MRLPMLFLTMALIALPAAAAESWKGVSLVDTQCATRVKADPDSHTTKCMLQCVKNGYGIFTPDGAYLKLDDAGNKLVTEALKTTKKTDHLRATVTGDRKGDTIKVTTLSLDEAAQ